MDDNFIDALVKATLVVVLFFLSYFFLPHILTPLDVSVTGDPIAFLQKVDIRPQRFAYMTSVLLTALMVLSGLGGLRIKVRLPKIMSLNGSRLVPVLVGMRQALLRFVTFLRTIDLPSIWLTLVVILAMIVGISFFRDDFGARTGALLFFSDTHAYLDFAGLGERLANGEQANLENLNVYGVGAAAIYAAFREGGFSPSYRLIYDLAWGFNIAFLFLWGACLIKIMPRRPAGDWFGIIFILGVCILVPPLVETKQVWTLYPTMSATRYVPFLLLFGFLAWGPHRINLPSQILAAALAFIGLCFAPDVGVVATLGFTAGVLLDRRINFWTLLRALGWFAILATVCFGGAIILRSILGYDLVYTLKIILEVADNSLLGVGLPWTAVGLLAFASAIFAIIYVGPNFFLSDLPKLDRIAFIASGMILIWGSYFIKRPDKNYWIYDALLLIILIFFASKAQGLKIWRQAIWPSIFVLFLFAALADEGIHRSVNFYKDMVVTQIREHSQPKMKLAGIYGPENWVRSSGSHMDLLNGLGERTHGKLVAVTGQPYLATMFATKNTVVYEGGFSLATSKAISDFADRVTLDERPVIAIDGPGSPQVFHAMGEKITELLSDALVQRGYKRLPSSVAPGWVVLASISRPSSFINDATSESAQ